MIVTAFSSTPRQRGNSDILTDHALEGAEEAGASIEKIRLNDYSLTPCTACDGCQKTADAPCIIDDDGKELIGKMAGSDAIILASPIYFFTVCAQIKILMDRSYALGGGGFWGALAGKRLGVILTYEDSNPKSSGVLNAIGMFKDFARFLKMELADIVHESCYAEAEILGNPQALKNARELGKKLGR